LFEAIVIILFVVPLVFGSKDKPILAELAVDEEAMDTNSGFRI